MCETGYENEIRKNFNKYQMLIKDAKNASINHTLLELLPVEEMENHEIWFKAKFLGEDEFSQGHKMCNWWSCRNVGVAENVDADSEIKPTDSVSDVGSVFKSLSKKSLQFKMLLMSSDQADYLAKWNI